MGQVRWAIGLSDRVLWAMTIEASATNASTLAGSIARPATISSLTPVNKLATDGSRGGAAARSPVESLLRRKLDSGPEPASPDASFAIMSKPVDGGQSSVMPDASLGAMGAARGAVTLWFVA